AGFSPSSSKPGPNSIPSPSSCSNLDDVERLPIPARKLAEGHHAVSMVVERRPRLGVAALRGGPRLEALLLPLRDVPPLGIGDISSADVVPRSGVCVQGSLSKMFRSRSLHP